MVYRARCTKGETPLWYGFAREGEFVVRITCFTDPMMGLSYEFEPTLRKLETHFAGGVEIVSAMGALAPSIEPFMTREERALPPDEGFARYNKRLAGIYKEEEAIAGMPINMEGFRLFSPEHRTAREDPAAELGVRGGAACRLSSCRPRARHTFCMAWRAIRRL